jgi:hypothetical protein
VSFYDWEYYNEFSKLKHMYGLNKVINRQRPYGDALQRRQKVQNILKKYLDCQFDIIDQKLYWNEATSNTISVCVPGQNNNMLDRGQLQWMAFGGITISPELPEILPWMGKEQNLYQPFQTYIKCKDDYSDLTNLIDYYMENEAEILELISNNAKAMFMQSCTPIKLVEWIQRYLKI